MKKYVTYIGLSLILGIITIIFYSCKRTYIHDEYTLTKPTLTLKNAEYIFEQDMMKLPFFPTKSVDGRPLKLIPGEFTPIWDNAYVGTDSKMNRAIIPIDAMFIFAGAFNEKMEDGNYDKKIVNITQLLMVESSYSDPTSNTSVYIVSVVPTPEYNANNSVVDSRFLSIKQGGSFSGGVLYRALSGRIISVETYRNGKLTFEYDFPTITDDNASELAEILNAALGTNEFLVGGRTKFSVDEDNPTQVEAKKVTVTGSRPNNNWYINITITGRPGPNDLPDSPVNVYQSPDNYTGGGGGGGGSSIPSQTGMPTDFIKKQNCDQGETQARTQTGKLFDFVSKQSKNPEIGHSYSYQNFIDAVRNKPSLEHAISFNKAAQNGDYTFLADLVSGNHEQVLPQFSENTLAVIHSHPNGNLTPPSEQDIISLAWALVNESPQIQAMYAIAGNDVYSLQIVNPDQAIAFYNANCQNAVAIFPPGTPAATEYKSAKDRMSNISNSNDRLCAILASVLSKCNSGIVLSKSNITNINFEAYGVQRNPRSGQFYPTKCQ